MLKIKPFHKYSTCIFLNKFVKKVLVLDNFSCQLDTPGKIQSVREFPLWDWPVGISVRYFLDCGVIENPTHSEWSYSWKVILACKRKQAENRPEEQAHKQHSSMGYALAPTSI